MSEEGIAVVRAGGGFGVILDAEDRQVFVPDAGDGLVVKIVFRYDSAAAFKRFLRRGKAMVLSCDRDDAGLDVLNRLISAAVSKGKLNGLSAEGVSDDLVPHADPKHRVVWHEVGDCLVGVGDG